MQFGEGLHGVASNCGAAVGPPDQFGPRTGCPTSYPAGITEGATFNRTLWSTVGAAIGKEARALHNQPQCYGQNNCNNVSGTHFQQLIVLCQQFIVQSPLTFCMFDDKKC